MYTIFSYYQSAYLENVLLIILQVSLQEQVPCKEVEDVTYTQRYRFAMPELLYFVLSICTLCS